MTDRNRSAIETIKGFPLASGMIAVAGALSFTAAFNSVGALVSATPMASAAVAIIGGLDLFDKQRSKLSRTFSAAALGIGGFGAILPFLVAGPAALGALLVSTAAMTVASAFNVAAYLVPQKQSAPGAETNAPAVQVPGGKAP